MQVGELYRHIRSRFRHAGLSTPDLDAKYLVGVAIGFSVSDIILRENDPVDAGGVSRANDFCEKRLAGMPVGRILGEREFYGRRFELNAATLEPRPDTEILIDAVLDRADGSRPLWMCDIGTGTGAIAVTLLAEIPKSQIIAVDISEQALLCASGNADLNGVKDRFFPVVADYGSVFRKGIDWIVSNPPYIRTAVLKELSQEVTQHDPAIALDGGADGLKAYERIITEAERILSTGGQIALEIGYDQAGDVKKQLRHHSFGAIEIIKDLTTNDRVVVAERI
ncbi:MAG: peptide chain release factor N(5)-glutamine methyltransferase [Roseibium sp.]